MTLFEDFAEMTISVAARARNLLSASDIRRVGAKGLLTLLATVLVAGAHVSDSMASIQPVATAKQSDRPIWAERAHIHKNGGGLVAASAKVDPSAHIAPGAMVMAGAEVCANAMVSPGSRIGPDAKVGERAWIGKNTRIMNGAVIGAWARLYGSNTIGVNAKLEQGTMLGDGTSVGADSVVGLRSILGANVWLGRDVMIGVGGNVFDGAKIGDETRIGDRVSIGKGVLISVRSIIWHDVGIGNFCKFGPECVIESNVTLGEHGWYGANIKVSEGNTVPANISVFFDKNGKLHVELRKAFPENSPGM
ncbi:MAG: hypothetical protein U9N14_02970 [Pseudomonadota bacterium]|nr:hypothetical protein [Pseudomonadota bacterium]